MKNRLNNLDSKTWLKFQKSWFIHNPPRRRKDVLRHPAKFPESLAQEFIEFFTQRGQVVLDPMAGTGSALVAALRAGRHCYGIELNPAYADIARQVIDEEHLSLGQAADELTSLLITGDVEAGALVSEQAAVLFQQYMPQAQIAHIAKAGHSIRRDRFERYMQVVQPFLANHAR